MSDNFNIVLIGFMGIGKTTIGRRAAAKLSMDFYDTDEFIKKCEKMSIDDIMRKKGEKYFEGAQRFAVTNLADNRHSLISTGGNTFCDEFNRKLLRENALVIWLRGSAKTVFENTKNSRNKRPEITGATVETIDKLLKEKEQFYKECDFIIDVDDKDPAEVADIIVNEYNLRCKD